MSCFAKNIQDIHPNWPLFLFLPYFCVTYLTLCCTCGHINQIHDSTQSYTSLHHNVLLAHPAAPSTCPPAGSESPPFSCQSYFHNKKTLQTILNIRLHLCKDSNTGKEGKPYRRIIWMCLGIVSLVLNYPCSN